MASRAYTSLHLCAQIGSLPFGTVMGRISSGLFELNKTGTCDPPASFKSGSAIAITSLDLEFATGWYDVLGQLMNIPTDTLIDMLFVIANGEVALTARDVAEIEQIQRELQRRGGGRQYCSRLAFD
jgi:hypothetical protein